jgi:hypothetical protein
MSRIRPENLDPEISDRSVAADALLRQEPDEEDDEEDEDDGKEDEDDGKEDEDDDEEDDGYSELNPPPPLHVLAGAWAAKWQVVLKPHVSVAEGEGRRPGRNQPR